jgi:RNase P subunit RPR2
MYEYNSYTDECKHCTAVLEQSTRKYGIKKKRVSALRVTCLSFAELDRVSRDALGASNDWY